jgi:hypothetical protein
MDIKSEALRTLEAIDGMAGAGARADHVDVVCARGDVTLREFVAAMFGRSPAWLRGLYRLRAGLAFCLGLRHQDEPRGQGMRPEDVPMTPGATLRFFTVVAASEDRHWVAVAEDSHLRAWIGVLVTRLPKGGNRFDVVTVVEYRNWVGPVYFNLIRPFHYLVVWRLARSAVAVRP